jgi:hypothetical protein
MYPVTHCISQAFDSVSDSLTSAADSGSLLVENTLLAKAMQNGVRTIRTHNSTCGSSNHASDVSLSKCAGCIAYGLPNAFGCARNSFADVLGCLSKILASAAADLHCC